MDGERLDSGRTDGVVIGLYEGKVRVLPLRDAEALADWEHRRPYRQWWLELRPILDVLASRLATVQAGPEDDLAG